jgi:hypothetical protein
MARSPVEHVWRGLAGHIGGECEFDGCLSAGPGSERLMRVGSYVQGC